jgi:hypothetical protein
MVKANYGIVYSTTILLGLDNNLETAYISLYLNSCVLRTGYSWEELDCITIEGEFDALLGSGFRFLP